jgi:AAA domain-containing protein/primase-like protein/DNA primase RepB-like protein
MLTHSSSSIIIPPPISAIPMLRNRDEARRFLRLLDPTAKAFTFQAFSDARDNHDASLARSTADREEMLQFYQRGSGVYVTINETDLTGRKSENIKRVRAIWQEDDEGHGGPFPLDPSLVVESSPGHFHRYWLIADDWPADEKGRADFAAVMERMCESYGSDKNAKDLSRVLRLPGFLHRKDPMRPHMVHIIEDSGKRYTRDEIMRAFPPVVRETKPRREWHAGDNDEERVADALRSIPADDRDVWLQMGMALQDEFGDRGRSLWDHWAASCPQKFEDRDQERTWKSFRRNGISVGTLFYHAQRHGWSPPQDRTESPKPQPENTEPEGSEIFLPAGMICDGDTPPAPRPKLIDGLLSTTGIVFLGGQGSAGKTYIAVGMAVSLATGESFFGRTVNEKVGTLIIAAEGREDMQARIAAAKKHANIEGDLPIVWMPVPTFGDEFLKDLDRVNTWMKAKHNVRLGAIVVDTVSASFSLKEEDNNAEAAKVCKVLRRLGEHINAVMVPVHHFGKDKERGLRGASAWGFNADMALAVDADIQPDGSVTGRSLAVTKDRGGVQGPVSAFDLVTIELATAEGEVFNNRAVLPTEAGTAAAASKWSTNTLRNLKRALDEVLPAHGRDEYPYTDGPICRVVDSDLLKAAFCRVNVVDSTPEKMDEAQRKAYTRALKSAQDKGLIQVKNDDLGGQIVWLAKPLDPTS